MTRAPLAVHSYDGAAATRVGFFTDTSLCIGCKACEVACKEWNDVPEDGLVHTGMSMDNTRGLGADSWRHVAFVEQRRPVDVADAAPDSLVTHLARRELADQLGELRWLMSSDVCKHCTHAACLEVCPTGSLFRTEFGTVVVQEDICNGCGYCVPACPFGVLDQRKEDGRVWKCTLCYDRLRADQEPACAQACPTNSIQFGPLEELREAAGAHPQRLEDAGEQGARLYLADPGDGIGGAGAFFLLLDEPEVYGLPPEPVDTSRHLRGIWSATLVAAGTMLAGVLASCAGRAEVTSREATGRPRSAARRRAAAGASRPWCRLGTSSPITVSRSSPPRCGRRRYRCTSSSAAWPARRPRSPSWPAPPATTCWPAAPR